MNIYTYYSDCIGWPVGDVQGGLSPMIDEAIDITRKTFLQHVDRAEMAELSRSLGYSDYPKQGLTMAGDWHVSYHRSKLHGRRCYFFCWSGIEHVFVEGRTP